MLCVGPHTCGMPWDYCITSVGKELPGFSTLLADQDENGEGEVCECCLFKALAIKAYEICRDRPILSVTKCRPLQAL